MRKFFSMMVVCLLHSVIIAQSLEVHHLNVGQGDASLILSKDSTGIIIKTVLIDGGFKKDGNIILTYLRGLGINKLDYVIASHYDRDHVGGLIVVLDYARGNPGTLRVDSVLDRGDVISPGHGTNYKTAANRYGSRRRTLIPGDSLRLFTDVTSGTGKYSIWMECLCVNGVVFNKALGNYDAVAGIAIPDENDLSTGFRIGYGKFRYLTCGDIGGKRNSQPGTCDGNYSCKFVDIETNLIAVAGEVSAYKVSHHGSRCSSNNNWVTDAKAVVAVISSGRSSKYKHPREEVVMQLNAAPDMVNFFMTCPTNLYGRTLAPKGILNTTNSPVILTVRKINSGVDIADSSKFAVQHYNYTKK